MHQALQNHKYIARIEVRRRLATCRRERLVYYVNALLPPVSMCQQTSALVDVTAGIVSLRILLLPRGIDVQYKERRRGFERR